MRTLAGALALVERGDDRAIQRHRARMVAHAGNRARRCGVLIRAHQIHQTRACPICIAVETGLAGFFAFLAVAGERGIDQAFIERSKLGVCHAESAAHRGGKIGDEDIGFSNGAMKNRLSLRLAAGDATGLLYPSPLWGGIKNYSPSDISTALPPAADVLMVTVCSVAKRVR